MKSNFKRTILVAALAAIAFNVSAQEALGTGTSLQTATAIGDRTYVSGSGSLLIDHMTVHAPGSTASGLLTAHDSGYAFGQGGSTFDGGVVGNMTIKATPGHVSGQGGSEQFATSQTTPDGVAHSNVGGKTTLFGQVRLPVDPVVTGTARDMASSGNIVGLPAVSSGFNWVQVDLSATMHH